MKRLAFIICAGFVLSACETTKVTQGASIEVRPVENISQNKDQQEFDAGAQLARAEKLHAMAKFAQSYDVYKTVLMRVDSNHQSYDRAMMGLADSALALGWRDDNLVGQARQIYGAVLVDTTKPPQMKHQANAGLLLLDLTDYTAKSAQNRLEQALQHSPQDMRLWNALGRVHDANANWLDALDAYVKAMSVAKNNGQSRAAVINNMGMSLLLQGRKQEAIVKFEQAVQAMPDMPVYANNLRLAQTLAGQTEPALEGLSDTRIAQIYNDAGVIAQTRGDFTKAARLYKKAIAKSPVYFKRAEQNLAGLTPNTHAASDEHDPVLPDAN